MHVAYQPACGCRHLFQSFITASINSLSFTVGLFFCWVRNPNKFFSSIKLPFSIWIRGNFDTTRISLYFQPIQSLLPKWDLLTYLRISNILENRNNAFFDITQTVYPRFEIRPWENYSSLICFYGSGTATVLRTWFAFSLLSGRGTIADFASK